MSNAVEPPGALSAPGDSSARDHSGVMPWLILAALMVAYGLLFGTLSLMRYWAFEMHALDMGNMGQAAWNTVHGHPFYFTNMRLPYAIEAWGTTTRLSFHVEALYPLISLVYVIYPHPESLLVLQTAALALGAVPVFLLARDVLQRVWPALAFAAAYLLFPSLEGMNLYEFHPVSLATPLLLFAFWFAWRRRYVPFVICCLAAMGTKEEIGLVVAMFGLYVALVNRDWAVGLGVAALGTAWSLFAALVVERHYRSPGTETYLRTRYGYLLGSPRAHGLHAVLQTLRREPGIFFRIVFDWPKAGYVNQLLAPTGYLAIGAAPLLALGAPTALLNLLSETPDMSMVTALGDNSAELISVVMIASILGAGVLLRVLEPWVPSGRTAGALVIYLLVVSLWDQRVNGFTPLGPRFSVPVIGSHQRVESRFVGMIPTNAPVATQDELDPALSSRRYLYLFLDTGRQPPLAPANYILLDASGPVYPTPSDQLHDAAEGYIHRPDWGIAAARDGLILIEKGAGSRHIPAAFYTFLDAGRIPEHHLSGTFRGLSIRGYDVSRVDLPNHRIPNLAYSIYLRPTQHLHTNLQPVVYWFSGRRLADCTSDALGLSWLPTSRWTPGHRYVVRMQPLSVNAQSPGTVRMLISLQAPPRQALPSCSELWRAHGPTWPAGTVEVSF